MSKKSENYRDPKGRHVRIYCKLLDSPAWRALGWSARSLFLDMRAGVGATNNGNISATLSTLKHRGWRSSETLANALFDLQALGFLVKTRGGGVKHGSKVCCLYRFTDLPMLEFPKLGLPAKAATDEYLRFNSVAEAEHALAAARAKRTEERERGKKMTLRKSDFTGSTAELRAFKAGSRAEDGVALAVRSTKRRLPGANVPKGIRHKDCTVDEGARQGNALRPRFSNTFIYCQGRGGI